MSSRTPYTGDQIIPRLNSEEYNAVQHNAVSGAGNREPPYDPSKIIRPYFNISYIITFSNIEG
jgi:hypothetical protein